MKTIATVAAVFLFALSAYSQTSSWLSSTLDDSELSKVEHKNRVTRYNLGPLWTQIDNASVFGFIGDNYQRLRMKIMSATKDLRQPDTYAVTGKSMVKNVIRPFRGTMKITNARVHKNPRLGLDDEYKNKGIKESGVIVGEYHLSEDRKQTNTGSFDGVFATYWYVDRNGRIKYDDIEMFADGYRNNQFGGTWTSYRNDDSKIANWGDYRIPLSGDLDIGAGEFSPDAKYLQYGWQSHSDAYVNNDKRARQEEERRWWR